VFLPVGSGVAEESRVEPEKSITSKTQRGQPGRAEAISDQLSAVSCQLWRTALSVLELAKHSFYFGNLGYHHAATGSIKILLENKISQACNTKTRMM
jgi:hypothetical protein